MKNRLRENDNFAFDDLFTKTIDLRSNLIEKRHRGTKRTPHCFFEFFLFILLKIKALVFENIAIFSKLDM